MSRSGRAAARDDLARPVSDPGVFHPDRLTELPEAARRFLGAALSPGVALAPVVRLEMEGEIKIREWTRFRGRQVLRAGEGFVWEALPVGHRSSSRAGGVTGAVALAPRGQPACNSWLGNR